MSVGTYDMPHMASLYNAKDLNAVLSESSCCVGIEVFLIRYMHLGLNLELHTTLYANDIFRSEFAGP
jgi:hypothetical protein